MKTVQKKRKNKYRNKSNKVRKTSSKRVFMDFETCGLPIFVRFPQPFALGYKEGEIIVLDPKTKQLTKIK